MPFSEHPSPLLKGCSEEEKQNTAPTLPCRSPFTTLPLGKSAPLPGGPVCNVSVTLWPPQLAQILPTEENFLLCFRQHVGSSTEFMEVRPRRCLSPVFRARSTPAPLATKCLGVVPWAMLSPLELHYSVWSLTACEKQKVPDPLTHNLHVSKISK